MPSQRKGTIYIITLGTALIVGMLAAAALLAVRSQRRQTILAQEILQARCNALTGLEMALFRFESNPSWRLLLKNNTWAEPSSTACGTYSFTGVDPEDGDLADDDFDPALITVTGTCGPAIQKAQVQLTVRQPGLRCLEPVIHAGGDLVLDATTVNGDRMISSDATISATNGSQVYVDAEAKTSVQATGGSVFHADTTTDGTWPRDMPATASVLNYYTDEGTDIDIEDLPLLDDEHITNSTMADGDTGWTAPAGGSLTLDTEASQTAWSLLVLGMGGSGIGPAQEVTDAIQNGETYTLSADVKALLFSMNMRISLQVVSSESGVQTFSTTWTTADPSAFTTVTGNVTPTWSGTLNEASWILESDAPFLAYKFDDASLTVANAVAGLHVLHRVVLSPTSNPFGAGVANASGIYVINCAKEPILVKDCRIHGTLVLINQDPDSSLIRSSVHFEPVNISSDPSVTNLPCLLSDKDLRLSLSSDDLDESSVNANFNPTGSPYEGVEDTDEEDVYPSLLKGVVYTTGDIYVESDLPLQGVLVGDGDVTFTGATVQADYDPVYYWDNAPPSFRDDLAIDVVPGSFHRVVD